MRNTAESELSSYKNFNSIKGDAENTKLADHSVNLITTAQAFHWFEVGWEWFIPNRGLLFQNRKVG